MNKKLRIINSEPLLLIALPVSIFTLFLIFIARPFIKIRIGFLHCDRIGHFAANTELYLCEKKHHKKEKTIDLHYFPRKVCNQQLARMWKRTLHIFPWFWIRPLDLIIRSFNIFKILRASDAKGGDSDRDIDNLLDLYPPHLIFTKEEEERGKNLLTAMGIPPGSAFVCMTVRDNAYLTQLYSGGITEYHNYRDSDIQNYVLAVEDLADRGYFVIRMGAKVIDPIKSTHSKVIDYAANGMRSDFMDIYLGSKCEFCISTSTGFDAVPLIFRRPIVYVNQVPFGIAFTFQKQFLEITKHHFLVRENRKLTIHEIFTYGVGFCVQTSDFESKGILLVENTPEEIRDVVIEMSERLEGVWQPHEDDEALQRRFWEIFPVNAVNPGGVPFHGQIRSRYGANFLRNNRWWLSKDDL